jgi:hypothetical protein
MITGGCWSY